MHSQGIAMRIVYLEETAQSMQHAGRSEQALGTISHEIVHDMLIVGGYSWRGNSLCLRCMRSNQHKRFRNYNIFSTHSI